MNTINKFISYIPREVSTTTVGVTLAAASGVAIDILTSSGSAPLFNSMIMQDFVEYSCYASGIVGTVITIYSMIHLCQKNIYKKKEFPDSINIIVLGGLGAALVQAIGNHFHRIAPSFCCLAGHTMTYAIATNFAWQASMIAGISGFISIAYATYRLAAAVHHQMRA